MKSLFRTTLVCLIVATLAFLGDACSNAAPAEPPPAVAVQVAPVETRDISLTSEWVGALDGYVNANIQPQVSGYLLKQNYREGGPVAKDAVLFEIDSRPFEASLHQAQGQLAQAQGQLAQAEAQVKQAQAQLGANELNVKRDQPEAEAHAIPQSQLENDTQARMASEAAVAAAQAAVQTQHAAVEAAQAQLQQAQLNVGFTQVRSLIAGVAGVAQVQIGNLVTPQTVLTVVSQLDPIKVYFPITSQEYLRAVGGAPGAVPLLDANRGANLELILPDGSVYPHRGRVLFADRQVAADTGTIRLAAAFPNPGNRLRPGQTARVRAVTEVLHGALVVPQSAVSQLQGAYQVAVVGPDQRVTIRTVEVGPTTGNDWVITSGLKPGESVVAEGTTKVREGTRVRASSLGARG